jgi:sugar lactone lactonase YvrE
MILLVAYPVKSNTELSKNMIEKLAKPELLFQSDADTGEGPVWSDGKVIWVDIPRGNIHSTETSSGKTSTVHHDAVIGAAVEIEGSSNFMMAMQDGFAIAEDGSFTVVDHILNGVTHRMNDAKCDALGRLWAGSCDRTFASGEGILHILDKKLPSSIAATGFDLPNGLGWREDNKVMYFVDSMKHEIYQSKFDLASAQIEKFELLTSVTFGFPDGLAVDVEDCIWLAVWSGSKVIRISPAGEVIAEIEMPVTQPSSCAFGPDGTLYITSARQGLSEADIIARPLAGSLFAVATNTRGVPVSKFKLV